jgi:cytochrome b6-f complex iron-sulfur subunit
MDRRNFIKNTCLTCAALAVGITIESCQKNNSVQPTSVNFTLDLTSSSNAALNNIGGWISQNNVIVIRTGSSTYAALSETCTHAGCSVSYSSSSKQLVCPCHGGVFDSNGNVVSGPPSSPLPQYKTSLSGNTLTVTS